MTNDEARRAQQRIADAQIARRAELREPERIAAADVGRVGGPFAVDDRVMDLRSGREGKVQHVGLPDSGGAPSVFVRFDDGSVGTRDPLDLLARPRRPGVGA